MVRGAIIATYGNKRCEYSRLHCDVNKASKSYQGVSI